MTARSFGALRGVVLTAILGAVFSIPAYAAAAECSVLDLSCDTASVGDAVSGATDGAAGAVDEVAGAAEDTANQAVDDVSEAASDATDAVGRLLGGGGDDPPPGGGSDDRGSGSAVRPGVLGLDTRRNAGTGRTAASIQRLRSGPFALLSSAAVVRNPADEGLAAGQRTPAGFFDSPVGRIVTKVARQLAFPVALLVVVLAFIVVQNRIDRRAPKLAVARVERDVVRFS